MNGGEHRNSIGYTIVETMIFLAISGVMFVLAAHFVNGKQAQAEFKQSINTFNQQVQGVINDVSNGFFPNFNQIKCTASTNQGVPPTITGGAITQGQNQGCVFLGKVIQFAPQGNSSTQYWVYTVAGRQYQAGGPVLATNFKDAQPVAITNPSLTVKKTMPFGVTIAGVHYQGKSPNPNCPAATYGIGFFGSFGQYVGADLASGAQSVVVTCIANAAAGQSETTFASAIHGLANGTDYTVHNSEFDICLQDGAGRKASLAIGSQNGESITTDLETGKLAPGC